MVNMIVAFGPTDDSFLIVADSRIYRSKIPSGMGTHLDSKLNTPITSAAIGEHGKWFLNGKGVETDGNKTFWNTGTLNDLSTKLKENTTTSVCFGPGEAWCWYYHSGSTYRWAHKHLETNQAAWITKMKTNNGELFRIFIGAAHTTVLLFSNDRIVYHACADKLANTLAEIKKQGLKIRHLALSPTNRNWFFIQLRDGSIVWYVPQGLAQHLRDFARDKDITRRKAETLEIVA